MLWAVVEKFMAKTIATLGAGHFESTRSILSLGEHVRPYGISEGGPWGGVFILLGAVEDLSPTLGACVHS